MAPSKDVVLAGSNAVASIDPDQVRVATKFPPLSDRRLTPQLS